MWNQKATHVKTWDDAPTATFAAEVFNENRVSEQFVVEFLSIHRQNKRFVWLNACRLLRRRTFLVLRFKEFQMRMRHITKRFDDGDQLVSAARNTAQVLQETAC